MMSWCCELSDLKMWAARATPNDKLLYYTGMSVQDTLISKEVGRLAYELAQRGLVYLVQKRSLGYHYEFNHFLVKASPNPAHSLVPFGDEKLEQLRRQKERIQHGQSKRTDEKKREREWRLGLGYPVR